MVDCLYCARYCHSSVKITQQWLHLFTYYQEQFVGVLSGDTSAHVQGETGHRINNRKMTCFTNRATAITPCIYFNLKTSLKKHTECASSGLLMYSCQATKEINPPHVIVFFKDRCTWHPLCLTELCSLHTGERNSGRKTHAALTLLLQLQMPTQKDSG